LKSFIVDVSPKNGIPFDNGDLLSGFYKVAFPGVKVLNASLYAVLFKNFRSGTIVTWFGLFSKIGSGPYQLTNSDLYNDVPANGMLWTYLRSFILSGGGIFQSLKSVLLVVNG